MAAEESARGYCLPPPAPGAMIAWPSGFGPRFALFVDTEEEFDWRAPFSRDRHGTQAIRALPAAHDRFAARGVAPIYLVDYPIAADPGAAEILGGVIADGRSAVGAQLHAWVTPPFDEALNGPNSFAGNLPRALEAAKLHMLTSKIFEAAGARPLIFRAGRYGIGASTFELLADAGYRIDCSVRSAYDYSSERGPDFSAIGNAAYRVGPAGILAELPFTTVFLGLARHRPTALYRSLGNLPHGRGVAARLGILSRVSLTPEDMPLGEALEAVRVAIGDGLPLLNFAFHSPSLEPGHTPYVRDAADLVAFWRWWDAMFDLLDRLGVRPASQAELLAACDTAGESASAAPTLGGL